MSTWKYWDDTGEHEWEEGAVLPSGTPLNKLEFINQFPSAFNERCQVAIGRTTPEIHAQATGDDAFLVLFFFYLQSYLVSISQYYVNHIDGPLAGDGKSFLVWTWERLTECAGIPNGYRRTTNGITFEYGYTTRRDVIGAWLFEDLRAVLNLLVYTLDDGGYPNRFTSASSVRESSSGWKTSMQLAIDDATSQWVSTPWQSFSNWYYYILLQRIFTFVQGATTLWQVYQTRISSRWTCPLDPDMAIVPHSCDIYVSTVHATIEDTEFVENADGYTDVDGNPAPNSWHIYFPISSFPESTDLLYQSGEYGNLDICPGDILTAQGGDTGYSFGYPRLLLKWTFTQR